jgi:hypothetical protein
MRSVLARLALSGLVGIALNGCSGGSSALPTGVSPNNSGGGPVNVSTQNPPTSSIPGVLLDGGVVSATDSYSGVNTTAADAQSASDAGTDPKTEGSGPPPADPAGSHAITFTGSGEAIIAFLFSGKPPNLFYSTAVPGQIQPVDYGALVLYSVVTPGGTPPAPGTPKVAVELTGGSGATTYDIRSTCGPLAAAGATPTGGLTRFVCALPPYGAAAGATATVTLKAATGTTTAVTTSYTVDVNIPGPRIADTSGSFTPGTGYKMYVELVYGSTTTAASTGNVLGLDYIYAESGTH